MNTQRIISIVRKNMRLIARDPASLFMILLFPVILTVVFGISFGAVGGEQSTTYEVGVVNMDGGPHDWSQIFVENLEMAEILKIRPYNDIESAEKELVQGNIQAIVVIPESFGGSIHSFVAAPEDPSLWIETTVELYLDSGSMFATQVIPSLVQHVLTETISGEEPTSPTIPVHIGIPSLVTTEKFTAFDYMAPGIFAFAAIFLIMMVAESFTMDRESGLLRRIRTTPTTSAEFMMGNALSNMVFAVFQVALVFVMAFLMGFKAQAGVAGILFAFVIVTVFALCSVGFGLITAAISKSPGAATGIAFIFIMPQMFLGTFVSVGLSSIAQAIGKFVPSYYVTDALTSLLLRGAPFASSTVLLDFAVVIIWSVVVLALGVFLFEKYGDV
jgi:ABC-2 type transport system permease protein